MATALGGYVAYVIISDLMDKVYILEETKELDEKINNYQENVKDESRFEMESVKKYKLMQEQSEDYAMKFHIQHYYIK